ncbi:YesK-like family protein [Paenibacillus tarimensis]|uniref:YesK-like family protein n=1 Tax=Paenibacillus tarimensis TaxID=416012 RepID=UPI001F421ECD|nr:YesK-like family protein [Paenibacillus tarimensis]
MINFLGVFPVAEMALLFTGTLILQLILAYTFKRLVPNTRPAVYAPFLLTLLLSISVLIYSFAVGGFKGMGLGVAALVVGTSSILAGLITIAAEMVYSRSEKER